MPSDIIQETLEKATEQAWARWSVRHPNLARVIDGLEVRTQTIQRLRDTEEYQAAVTEFYQASNEVDLFNRILDLAGPMIKRYFPRKVLR